jgi:hypothetical protein
MIIQASTDSLATFLAKNERSHIFCIEEEEEEEDCGKFNNC